jgi:hypothetical protein
VKKVILKTNNIVCLFLAGAITISAGPVLAWGDEGHSIVRHIAYELPTPRAKSTANAMPSDGRDTLTAPKTASNFALRPPCADNQLTKILPSAAV